MPVFNSAKISARHLEPNEVEVMLFQPKQFQAFAFCTFFLYFDNFAIFPFRHSPFWEIAVLSFIGGFFYLSFAQKQCTFVIMEKGEVCENICQISKHSAVFIQSLNLHKLSFVNFIADTWPPLLPAVPLRLGPIFALKILVV